MSHKFPKLYTITDDMCRQTSGYEKMPYNSSSDASS